MVDISNVCYYCGSQSIPNFRYNGVKVCPEHAPADEGDEVVQYIDEEKYSAIDTTAPENATDYVDTLYVPPLNSPTGFRSCPKCNPTNEATFKVNLYCDICNGSGFICL